MTDSPPLSKIIFGEQSAQLPPAIKNRYANRLGCNDRVKIAGTMTIKMAPVFRLMSFLFRWTKTLIPTVGENLPAEVVFITTQSTNSCCYDRTVTAQDGTVLKFISTWEKRRNNQMIEWTRLGIGWECRLRYENSRVALEHSGYRFKIGRLDIPLPLSFFLGRPKAWEQAISDTEFEMQMVIEHWLLGSLYEYSGRFEIKEVEIA